VIVICAMTSGVALSACGGGASRTLPGSAEARLRSVCQRAGREQFALLRSIRDPTAASVSREVREAAEAGQRLVASTDREVRALPASRETSSVLATLGINRQALARVAARSRHQGEGFRLGLLHELLEASGVCGHVKLAAVSG
jgi:hypothetical protein